MLTCLQNLGYLLFNQHDTDHNSRAENTPTPAANLRHTQPEHAVGSILGPHSSINQSYVHRSKSPN
jgi:hypothetical protein